LTLRIGRPRFLCIEPVSVSRHARLCAIEYWTRIEEPIVRNFLRFRFVK
jgi:hypothetical protein